MKTRTLYICEKCGTEYEYENSALYCEGYELHPPKPDLHVGSKVYCYNQNEEPDIDIVVSIELRPYFNLYIDSWKGDIDKMVSAGANHRTHEWIVITTKYRFLGKDESSYTNEMSLDLIWLPGGEKGMFTSTGSRE